MSQQDRPEGSAPALYPRTYSDEQAAAERHRKERELGAKVLALIAERAKERTAFRQRGGWFDKCERVARELGLLEAALVAEVREPAYGAAAERYRKERELGARVVEILRKYPPGAPQTHSALVADSISRAARTLGLLPSDARRSEASRGEASQLEERAP